MGAIIDDTMDELADMIYHFLCKRVPGPLAAIAAVLIYSIMILMIYAYSVVDNAQFYYLNL